MDGIDRRDNHIMVVGNMAPIVHRLGENGYEVLVVEWNPLLRIHNGLLDSIEYRILREVDIVIVTGATLINDTVDMVLDASRKAHTRILVGPTASIYPEPFLKAGFTHIGIYKDNWPRRALKIVELGGRIWNSNPLF